MQACDAQITMLFRTRIIKTVRATNSGWKMFGVVLWSDPEDRKAVIWCEDHGDLAFFGAAHQAPLPEFALDAGDLVQFDLTEEQHLRFAHNPRLVSEGACPDLADALAPNTPTAPQARSASAEIILFEPRKAPPPRNMAQQQAVLSAS